MLFQYIFLVGGLNLLIFSKKVSISNSNDQSFKHEYHESGMFTILNSYLDSNLSYRDLCNKGRFCNTIASVALVHTSIQSD